MAIVRIKKKDGGEDPERKRREDEIRAEIFFPNVVPFLPQSGSIWKNYFLILDNPEASELSRWCAWGSRNLRIACGCACSPRIK